MECVICMNDKKEFEKCKQCNNEICINCLKTMKQYRDNVSINCDMATGIFKKEMKVIKCPFCRDKLKMYVYLYGLEYEVLGYDKRNKLYKLFRYNSTNPITYCDINDCVHFCYVPKLDFPSIFEEDLKKNVYYTRCHILGETSPIDIQEDNNERMWD